MDALEKDRISQFVADNIVAYHEERLKAIQGLNLSGYIGRKNPYLFRAKNITRADQFAESLLQAVLSSSEETTFGQFLEDLAVFVAQITCNGQKSTTTGIDIDLTKNGCRYLIAVKSGKNWHNSTSLKKQKDNFQTALKVANQSRHVGKVQAVLGICYGNFKTLDNGAYLHIGGQSFWHLISDDPNLYVDIIEPLGHKADEFEKRFVEERDMAYNRVLKEFTSRFCDNEGRIDWQKLVSFVSGNMQV